MRGRKFSAVIVSATGRAAMRSAAGTPAAGTAPGVAATRTSSARRRGRGTISASAIAATRGRSGIVPATARCAAWKRASSAVAAIVTARRRSRVVSAIGRTAWIRVPTAARWPAWIRVSSARRYDGLVHIKRRPPRSIAIKISARVVRVLVWARRLGRLRIVRSRLSPALPPKRSATIRLHLLARLLARCCGAGWRSERVPPGPRGLNRTRSLCGRRAAVHAAGICPAEGAGIRWRWIAGRISAAIEIASAALHCGARARCAAEETLVGW
jgi:hypothetical protein